ncbi:cytochrome P450 6k1-like isoform X3 [Polyergus mexicanus]|uniref:cytochrome P450 6k1-like isoform X3 n=1 Tax=Polyergus mexicanus TaxID=615972 RepID=UPI0038B51E5C
MLISFILIVIIIKLFWIYARYKLSYWKQRGVESLTSNLIFGNFKNAVLFRTAPGWHIGQLYKAARTDAPFIGFYIFHKPCLLLRDPDIIKQFMIRDFHNFCDRHFAGSKQRDSIGMKNLFGLNNPIWKYVRTKFTPTLTISKLKRMFPLMMEIGDPMMDYLKHYPADHDDVKLVDAQELSYKYTTDLFASIALGTKMDTFHYPNEEFSTEAKVFWNAMKNREKTGEKRGDFIDFLLQLKHSKQNPDYKFEGENLLYQSGIFLSGFESSASCISFTLLELAKHSTYQKLARQDINRAIDKHGWTYEAFQDMKYLDQTIAESLRLHPPLSTIDRCTREDYKIPNTDIVIEKGTPIYISLYGLGADPRFWNEPEVYNPDRFNKNNHVTDAYMPFGIGYRMCIGMKVGQLHAKVVLALLLRDYEMWQTKDNESFLNPRSTFTAAGNGINLHFKRIITRASN